MRRNKAKLTKVEVYDSDDERTYARAEKPDPTDNSFFCDEVDNFHSEREKILLDKGAEISKEQDSSDEEEVLGFSSDSDDANIEEYEKRLKTFQTRGFKDEFASDIEDEKDDLPNEKGWGWSKKKYYGADTKDNERLDFSGSEPDTALLEEEEALAIQKRMAEQLDDQDFGFDMFQTMKSSDKQISKVSTLEEEKIEKDLSKLTKTEKLELLKQESPELLQLIEDYKLKMIELQERMLPIQTLIRSGKLPRTNGSDYIEAKVKLYLNYCINITYYLMLKAKRTPVENHPVIERIVQYRKLLKQMEVIDVKVSAEIDDILEKLKNGHEIEIRKEPDNSGKETISKRKRKIGLDVSDKHTKQRNKKLSTMLSEDSDDDISAKEMIKRKKKEDRAEGRYMTKGEQQALNYYQMMKSGLSKSETTDELEKDIEMDNVDEELGVRRPLNEDPDQSESEGVDEENRGDTKRAITYEIAKNKGLTPKRKKEQRNPRVKHRNKYRKAKIRRKGQVREVRTELHKYGGEISGIRATMKRSVKLK